MINEKNIKIRDAEFEDVPSIIKIYNSTIPGRMVTADTEPVSVQSRLKWFEEHSPGYRPIWVLENVEGICGWLSFQSFYGRPAYKFTVELSLYLDEKYRNKGFGSYLLEKAIASAPSLGIKTLLGFVFRHNVPSLGLFHKYGFTEWGALPKVADFGNEERDLLVLGKRL